MKRIPLMENASSPGKRLLSGLTITLALTVPSVVIAAPAPTLPADAEYSQVRLAPNPAGHAWGNVIPNALADYFTFLPYSTTDAVALGFPNTCGAVTNLAAVPPVIGEDCYTITAQQFQQQLALPSILGGTAGLISPAGTYFGAANYPVVNGYGSGGVSWTPPQFVFDAAATPAGIRRKVPADTGGIATVTGNAPKPFVDGTYATTGIWHFPAPSIKGTKGRPIRIQWLNELPNTVPPGHDPTIDCSASSPNCFPYNRIVTHVHGEFVVGDQV